MAEYTYDFTQADGAPTGLTVNSGTASVVSNQLVVTADTTLDLISADDTLTRDNYVVDVDFTPGGSYGGGQRCGLMIHFQDTANYYYCVVKTGSFGGVYLYRYKASSATLIASDPSAGSRSISNGVSHNLEVSVSDIGGNIAFDVVLDTVSIMSFTDSVDPIAGSTGKIGVYQSDVSGDNVTFDNLHVLEGQATPVVTIAESNATVMCALGETTYEYTFNATATDEEDGDLTASITWRYRTDGGAWNTISGTGGGPITETLPIGVNEIEASATDSAPSTGTDTVTITVQAYAFGGTVPAANGFIAGNAGMGHTADVYAGDGVRVFVTEQPSNAKIFVKHDGSLVVYPDNPSVTSVTFKYRIRDQGGISNEATITLTT